MTDSTEYQYHGPQYGPYVGHVETDFAMGKNMDEMKAMLSNADPGAVDGVAKAWKSVEQQLVGADGAKALLETAVDHILQTWEGSSADGFAAEAKKISKKITDGATYAKYTGTAMQSAADALTHYKGIVEKMQKPDESSSLGDHIKDAFTGHHRSDAGLKADLAKGVTTQQALDSNRGDLSKGKEAQLEMAVKMEELAVVYSTQRQTMGSWTKTTKPTGTFGDKDDNYPGDPGGNVPVAFIPVSVESPSATTSRRSSTSGGSTGSSSKSVTSPNTSGTGSREAAVSGGTRQATTVSKPQVGTGLDGISGTGTGAGTTGGGASGVSTGAGTGARGSAGGSVGGSSATAAGAFGGVSGGTAGSGSSTAGRTGAAGRGMSGQSGAGAGKLGESKTGTGKGSSLARKRGGVVGEAEGGTGKGSQGGSGLHKSRGGKEAGKVGKGSGRMGGRGVNTEAEEEESRTGQRPDYLVEDEDTWVSDVNVAPRVIE
ncbi:WXG100 family type VII secretion target [Streptomyces sp. NPDC059373]